MNDQIYAIQKLADAILIGLGVLSIVVVVAAEMIVNAIKNKKDKS